MRLLTPVVPARERMIGVLEPTFKHARLPSDAQKRLKLIQHREAHGACRRKSIGTSIANRCCRARDEVLAGWRGNPRTRDRENEGSG